MEANCSLLLIDSAALLFVTVLLLCCEEKNDVPACDYCNVIEKLNIIFMPDKRTVLRHTATGKQYDKHKRQPFFQQLHSPLLLAFNRVDGNVQFFSDFF